MMIICFTCLSLCKVEKYSTKEAKSPFKHRPCVQRKSRAQAPYKKGLGVQKLPAACEWCIVGRHCNIWETLQHLRDLAMFSCCLHKSCNMHELFLCILVRWKFPTNQWIKLLLTHHWPTLFWEISLLFCISLAMKASFSSILLKSTLDLKRES